MRAFAALGGRITVKDAAGGSKTRGAERKSRQHALIVETCVSR
jgi:hypothetical protein